MYLSISILAQTAVCANHAQTHWHLSKIFNEYFAQRLGELGLFLSKMDVYCG